MKKTLVAVAVAAAAAGATSAAGAQTNVVLYGIADGGLGYERVDGSPSDLRVDSGTLSGSRFGIRGSEDLGSGLKANFRLESGFNLDDGRLGQSGRVFGRQAWVGLSGDFGEFRIGRQNTFGFDWFARVSPFGTAYKQAQIGTVFGYGAIGDRIDNSIFYLTPKFGGLAFGVGYSFNGNGQETGANDNEVLTVGAQYANGPIDLVAVYEVRYDADATKAPGRDDIGHLGVGGSYAITPAWKAFAGYGSLENRNFIAGATREKAWTVGLSTTIGSSEIFAAYQTVDGRNRNEFGSNTDRDGIAIGYNYALSKRTTFYAYGSQVEKIAVRADDASRVADSLQVGLGIRHAF